MSIHYNVQAIVKFSQLHVQKLALLGCPSDAYMPRYWQGDSIWRLVGAGNMLTYFLKGLDGMVYATRESVSIDFGPSFDVPDSNPSANGTSEEANVRAPFSTTLCHSAVIIAFCSDTQAIEVDQWEFSQLAAAGRSHRLFIVLCSVSAWSAASLWKRYLLAYELALLL